MSDLGISISLDSSQYTASLTQIQSQTKNAAQNIDKSLGSVSTAAKQMGDAIESVTTPIAGLANKSQSLNSLNKQFSDLNNYIRTLAPNTNEFIIASQDIRVVSERIRGVETAMKGVTNETNKAEKAIKDVGDSSGKSGGFLSSFLGGLGSFGQIVSGGGAIAAGFLLAQAVTAIGSAMVQFGKDSIAAASEVQTINRALSFTAGGADEGAAAYDRFKNTANELGISIEKNQRAFKNFVVSATQSGLSLQQAETEFKQVAIAITAMGLSAEDSNGVLLALGQIASKGTVSAEELRGQIGERLPGAFTIAARSIGVTESELNKMLQKGEVISKDFLPKFTAELEKTFGASAQEGVNSYAANINKFDNQLLELKVSLGEQLIPVMIEFLQVGKDVVETFGGAKAIFEVLGKAIRGVLPVELFQQIGNGFKFIKDQYLEFLGVIEVSKKAVDIPIKLSFANKQDELASAQATLKQLRETVAGGDGSTLTGASAGKFFEAMQQIPKYERDILRLQAEIKGAAGAAGGLSKEQEKAAAAAKKQAEALAKIGEKGSLGFLENELKKINEQFQTTAESKLNVSNLLGKKEDIEAQIKRLKELYGIIKDKPEAAAGSVAALQKQLAELNKQISESPKDLGLLVSLEKKALDVEKQLKAAILLVTKADFFAKGLNLGEVGNRAEVSVNLPDAPAASAQTFNNASAITGSEFAIGSFSALTEEITKQADAIGGLDAALRNLALGYAIANNQSLDFAKKLEETFKSVKEDAFQSLGQGLATVAQTFGNSLGEMVVGISSFEDVVKNSLKALGQAILVELPKVVGMGLVQSAFSPTNIAAFPASAPLMIPLLVAGLALVGASGLIGGALSGIGGGNGENDNSITGQLASANQISAVGSTPQRAIGLGGQSVTQSDNITNVTLILETNGIIDAIQKQEYINNELRGQ